MGANHYDVLGLDLAATPAEIRARLDDLIAQAQASVSTAPEQSRRLWAQVRQIRQDLLSDRSLREQYDLQILAQSDRPGAVTLVSPRSPYVPPNRPRLAAGSAIMLRRHSGIVWPALAAAERSGAIL